MVVQRVAALLSTAVLACLAVLALVDHDTVRPQALLGVRYVVPMQPRFSILSPPQSRNWRLNNEALPCAEDPDCGYGSVVSESGKDAAYADPSPLAIINEQYGEGDVNPAPGPRNWGPDSPAGTWLPEEEMPGFEGMVRKVWPDYPEVAEAT